MPRGPVASAGRTSMRPRSNMELNPEDLAKITDFTLSHYNKHAEDFWEGTRDHNVNQNITALLQSIEGELPYTILDFGCEVWQQDFLKLDLPDRHFDGVFANAALFHVPCQELPRVLLELYARLKPGGVLFSSNPHGHNEEGWNGGRYGVYHDLDTWRSYVSAAGFVEINHYYRPAGLPRERQPWLASVWRRSDHSF